ncbi:MAG: Imm26 family immunity protein [Pseudomonadota bacterium]
MSFIEVKGGEIYFIPLFLGDDYSLKNYAKYNFQKKDLEFCFCRIIASEDGAGILIEIFNHIGPINSTLENIIESERIIEPIYVAGDGIAKKRWRKIGESQGYDKEKNSDYSKIKFILGRGESKCVWCNGKEFPLENFDDHINIESHKIWTAAQIENRLIELIKEKSV